MLRDVGILSRRSRKLYALVQYNTNIMLTRGKHPTCPKIEYGYHRIVQGALNFDCVYVVCWVLLAWRRCTTKAGVRTAQGDREHLSGDLYGNLFPLLVKLCHQNESPVITTGLTTPPLQGEG